MDILVEINPTRGRVQFSWAPPPVQQQNGVILEYVLVCTTENDVTDVVLLYFPPDPDRQYTAVGFTALTQYTCYVSALNSVGEGPFVNITVTTGEDGE